MNTTRIHVSSLLGACALAMPSRATAQPLPGASRHPPAVAVVMRDAGDAADGARR